MRYWFIGIKDIVLGPVPSAFDMVAVVVSRFKMKQCKPHLRFFIGLPDAYQGNQTWPYDPEAHVGYQ